MCQFRKRIHIAVAYAEKHGWSLHLRNAGHIMFLHPTYGKVFAAATTSDCRAQKNMIRDMKKQKREWDETNARSQQGGNTNDH